MSNLPDGWRKLFHVMQLKRIFLRDPAITLGNDTNEFIIVNGVNHVATGKATYSSFAVYGADVWNGVGAITDAEFTGSAEEYLPDNPNAKYLYVYKIARNCDGDPYCYEVPYGVGGYGKEDVYVCHACAAEPAGGYPHCEMQSWL